MGPRYAFIGPLETMHLNADGESWPTASPQVSKVFVLFDTPFFSFFLLSSPPPPPPPHPHCQSPIHFTVSLGLVFPVENAGCFPREKTQPVAIVTLPMQLADF